MCSPLYTVSCICAHTTPSETRTAVASVKDLGDWEQGTEGALLLRAFYSF